jgi:hypothetical protein
MPSPLLSALPVTVTLGGERFPIRHDFRDGIRFEAMVDSDKVPEQAKVSLALDIWYPTRPPRRLAQEAIDAMLDFYRCGKDATESASEGQLYSFEHDWDAIFAAFLSAYRINLLDTETTLHWWEFRSMLTALPEDSQFMRIIEIRSMKPSDVAPEQRAHLARMKRMFALPNVTAGPRTAEEADALIAECQAARELAEAQS